MQQGLATPSAMSESSDAFPTQAQVVVIGGGIVGASLAYHLTERGWRDVGQLRATYNRARPRSPRYDLHGSPHAGQER